MLAGQLPMEEVQTYRAGFSAAIAAVATAFHITLDPRTLERPNSAHCYLVES
jgi:hypothetical protein